MKPLTTSQVPEIVKFAIRSGAFEKAHGQRTYDPVYITGLWASLIEQNQAGGQVVYEGDTVVGAIVWALCGNWYSPEEMLDIIVWAVDPHHKGLTVGGKLLQAAIHEADTRGVPLSMSLGPSTPVTLSWALGRWGFTPGALDYERPIYGKS